VSRRGDAASNYYATKPANRRGYLEAQYARPDILEPAAQVQPPFEIFFDRALEAREVGSRSSSTSAVVHKSDVGPGRLDEGNAYPAYPPLLAIDNAACKPASLASDNQGECFRNTDWACYIQRGSGFGQVANRAIDCTAAKLNRSGFQNAMARIGSLIDHSRAAQSFTLPRSRLS
jgi:hypothetical protein